MLFLTIFFTIPVEIENARLKLALAIANDATDAIEIETVANDAIEILPLVTDKTINDLSNNEKKQYVY